VNSPTTPRRRVVVTARAEIRRRLSHDLAVAPGNRPPELFDDSGDAGILRDRGRHRQQSLPVTCDVPLAVASLVDQQVEANNALEGALSRLLVVVENYPNLKADVQFTGLRDQLEGTENRIAVERQRYNETVKTFNARVKSFPTVIIARMFGFDARTYLLAPSEAQNAPKVDFSSQK
jgi:hypothetical protein